LAIGRPIGTLAAPASAIPVHAVTSTAASVGPYRLCTAARGSRAWLAATKRAGSASPLHTICRSGVQRATAASARNSSNIDGTKCTVVTPYRTIASHRYAGSLCPSGRAITSRAPTSTGHSSSHTDTSNVVGVFCSTVSPGPSPYARCIHVSRFTTPRCATITPLGCPVEPDV
jgi:hypothetical protein